MEVEETLKLIANPYSEAKLSIINSSSGFEGFMKFYNNFLSKCSDFSKIEVLLKVDSHKDMHLYEDILKGKNIKYKFIAYPVFNLRHSMHLFFNDLGSIASTNLIWIAAEDINIIGNNDDWLKSILSLDKKLSKKYKDGIYTIGVPCVTEGGKPIRIGKIQLATKKWIEALGEIAPFPNVDRWMYFLADGIGRMDAVDKKELMLEFPKGSRTFSKKDKKHIFKPVIKEAIKKMKSKLK